MIANFLSTHLEGMRQHGLITMVNGSNYILFHSIIMEEEEEEEESVIRSEDCATVRQHEENACIVVVILLLLCLRHMGTAVPAT